MSYSNKVAHSDENIREFLESGDPIELYCVTQFEDGSGLIHSFNVKEGRFYNLLLRDDELNQSCVEYLKRQSLPVFEYSDDLGEYEKELQKKYKDFVKLSSSD